MATFVNTKMELILNPLYYAGGRELGILKSINTVLSQQEEDAKKKLTFQTIATIADAWYGFRCQDKHFFTPEDQQLFDEYKMKFGIEK